MMTTQKQIRAAFWVWGGNGEAPRRFSRKRGRDGDYSTDTRCAFVNFVDMLQRDGQISEKLAQRVTL